MSSAFSFSAIVGQDNLKHALLLGVIQPHLGGVLIRGTKGIAKSTAVRALAKLLPPLETVAGCPFNRRPGESIPDWPLPSEAPLIQRAVPLVELPLGATEDRVLGSLHLEKALHGQRAFEPGLLASANRGILYVDEVNLLPDHLVDLLLDASASGIHRVEREGLSLVHPARFLLIGTMNPEEGDLRPQLLDRFGLSVDVTDLTEVGQRAEAVRRRLTFQADAAKFLEAWQASDAKITRRVVAAQRLLPQVRIDETFLQAISARCLAAGVEGLRADLTLCQAACAWAAYDGRDVVRADDIEAVAELALGHRRGQPPEPPRGQRPPSSNQQPNGNTPPPAKQPESGSRQPIAGSSNLTTDPSAGLFKPQIQPSRQTLAKNTTAGRWHGLAENRGRLLENAADSGRVAWSATLRQAAIYQLDRGRTSDQTPLRFRPEDVRTWQRHGPSGCLLLFVVDASGSMTAWKRMRETKSAVRALLVQAYQHGDQVALLAFRGNGTELVLPPRRGLAIAHQALENLPAGGTTPLAHGLANARQLVKAQQRKNPRQPIWTVVLTDGRSNIPLHTHNAWADALREARLLSETADECLVIDTETGWLRFGKATELATAMNAKCKPLEEVLSRGMTKSAAG